MRIKGNYSHCLTSQSKAGVKVQPESGPQPRASSPELPVGRQVRSFSILLLTLAGLVQTFPKHRQEMRMGCFPS